MPGNTPAVERLGVLLAAQDHASARSAQGLVRRGGDEVRVRHRARVAAGGDQAGDVRHVHHQQRSRLVGDLPEPGVVHGARISARPGHDESRALLAGQLGQRIVVDGLGVLRDAVGNHVVQPPGEVHGTPHGQVSAVGQVHAEVGVAGVQHREVHGHVRLGTGMRLDIDVLRSEQRPGPLHRQTLHHVHVLAAAVVAPPRIALRVLVGHERTLGLEHGLAHYVLGGDQLQVGLEAVALVGNRLEDFGIDLLQAG